MVFTIIIKPDAEEDIEYYRTHEQRAIIDGIKMHLRTQPGTVSNRKKPLRPNAVAPWELRIDIYRAFYTFDDTSVTIVAIGHKVHNTLYIRGKEVQL